MKKDIEWLKSEVNELPLKFLGFSILKQREEFAVNKDDVMELIDQLDEPETLSQEWIGDNSYGAFELEGTLDNLDEKFVSEYDLQNLLVPKQDELEVKIQELIETYKQEDAYSNPENGWIGGFIEDLKNLVEKEQKYYVLGKHGTPILFRDHRNRITETSNLNDIYPKADSEDFEFTEQEIKDYDERYWPFAEEVQP